MCWIDERELDRLCAGRMREDLEEQRGVVYDEGRSQAVVGERRLV